MLAIAQICRQIRFVTFLILWYAIGGYLYWIIIYSQAVWSPQFKTCEDFAFTDPMGNYQNVKTPLLHNTKMPSPSA